MVIISCDTMNNVEVITIYQNPQVRIAEQFVEKFNEESTGYTLEVVKVSTLQEDYVVFSCQGSSCSGDYMAINIGNYSASMSAEEYFKNSLNDSATRSYLDVYYIGSEKYQDYLTGITFEKNVANSKDLAKMNALAEAYRTDLLAKSYSDRFGLSQKRSLEVAKLHNIWRKTSKKAMTDKELDDFSTELLGFSIGDATQAFKNYNETGDSAQLDELVQKAAGRNLITPEHATKIISTLYSF